MCVTFGAYAREWVLNYQGRTSNGFRERSRQSYGRMLEAPSLPAIRSSLEPRPVTPS